MKTTSELIRGLKVAYGNNVTVRKNYMDEIIQRLMEFDEVKSVIHDTVDPLIELYSLLFAVTGEFEQEESMRKEIIVCDGCEATLIKTSDIYHLNLKTNRFWNGIDNEHRVEYLDFCQRCAKDIKKVLQKICEDLSARETNSVA